MNRYENDDELERALFAMPLEEPPAGLRRSILAATVDAPVPNPSALWMSTTETVLYGVLVALLVWLCVAVGQGDASPVGASLRDLSFRIIAFFSQPDTVLWLCAGAAIAAFFSNESLTRARGFLPNIRR